MKYINSASKHHVAYVRVCESPNGVNKENQMIQGRQCIQVYYHVIYKLLRLDIYSLSRERKSLKVQKSGFGPIVNL